MFSKNKNMRDINECIDDLIEGGPTGFSMCSKDFVYLQNEFNQNNKDKFFEFIEELKELLIKYNCTIEGDDKCIQFLEFHDFFKKEKDKAINNG